MMNLKGFFRLPSTKKMSCLKSFCIEGFLLITLVIHFSNAFDFQCPSSQHWVIRGKSQCLKNNPDNMYTCLFDDNNNIYQEICRNKHYYIKEGYKFVIKLQPDHRNCEATRFQPFRFSTNGSTFCVFEKTNCGDEGQIIFNNGSTSSDRQCRCDYTRGYAFTTKPDHGCYCVPSMEDCSCYHKPCPSGLFLGPDYQCISITSWKSQFTCKLILSTKPRDRNQPSNDKKIDDGKATLDRNVKSLLSIMIGVTLIVALIVIVYTTVLCLQNNESLNYANNMNKNIKDLQQYVKKQWKRQFNHFVETTACKAIIDKIKEEQCLIIYGPHGCGKSSLVFHTAMKLETTQGFDVMIISDPNDILRYASKHRKQLFLIDDVFGKYSVREYDKMWWDREGKSVQHLLTRNRSLRLLMTSRLHIYRSVNLKHIKACSLNLISQELTLTSKEIENIGICYLREDTFDHLKENVVFFHNFFPALCAIFSNNMNNGQSNVVEYFTHPVEYIKTEIENFKDPINQFYLALAVLIVCNNSVNKYSLDQDNHTMMNEMLEFLSKEIGYGSKPNKQLVRLCFTALTDSYISKTDYSFECLNVNLFEVLAFCIGPNIINSILQYGTTSFITERMHLETTNKYNPKLTILIPKSSQDFYLERMLLDLKSGLHYIFKGNHHVLPEVRKLHIQYMETHLKNCDLKKGSDGITVLHVLSEEGYEDYVKFFLTKKYRNFQIFKTFVNEQDNLGQTALHKACIKEHLNVAKLLLDNSININTSDNDDKTALDIACSSNSIDIVDLLLSRRATISQKKTDLKSALHVACEKNYLQVVKLILSNKVKLDQVDAHNNTPLHLACKQGHEEIVDLLLKNKPFVDIPDYKGRTALYLAVNENNIKIVKSLLEINADTNRHTDEVRYPLHCACQYGSLEIARLLITHHAFVDIIDLNECTPLFFACSNGYFEVAKLLLEKEAKANKPNKLGNTPILAACKYNHVKIIKLLLDNEADVNCKNKAMMTPLHVACANNSMDIVLLLISYGALINELNENHHTPLLLACLEGYHIVATELTRHGASVNMANQDGETPLYITCKEGHEGTVKMLLNAGANVNQNTNDGMTPLHMACKGDREYILKVLLNAGVDLNMAYKDGSTPLEIIQKTGRKKIVSLVLKANDIVTQRDSNEMSPIYMACKDGNEAAVRELLNACVNMNEGDEDGITPLHVACKGGREQIVALLINSGVSVNTGDRNGITPLHLACEDGNKAIVRLLLDSFANVNMGDNEGTTALHIACKSGDQDFVKYLLAAGAYVNKCNKNGVSPLFIAFNSGSEETLHAVSNLSAKGVADKFVNVQSTCKGGREDIVRLLLNEGANVNPDKKDVMNQIKKKSILDIIFRKS